MNPTREELLFQLALTKPAAERLAMMDHPNIAKVLDDGMTEPLLGVPPSGGPARLKPELQTLPSGRPCFVMELVRGIRITDDCDQSNLSTP